MPHNTNINPEQHKAFVENEGGLFWSGIGFATANFIGSLPLEPLNAVPVPEFELYSYGNLYNPTLRRIAHASVPLYEIQRRAYINTEHQITVFAEKDSEESIARLNECGALIEEADLEAVADYSNVNYGLSDPEFPIHFSSVVANASLGTLIDAGVISQPIIDKLGIRDYAAVIGSKWFARLIHTCTPPPFAYWSEAGKFLNDYFSKIYKLQQLEAQQYRGSDLWKVTVGDDDRQAIRRAASQEPKTTGCPAARSLFRLERGQDFGYRHAGHLVELGRAALSETDSGTVVRLEETSITSALKSWAGYLRSYVSRYGEPRYDIAPGRLAHQPPSSSPPVISSVIAA